MLFYQWILFLPALAMFKCEGKMLSNLEDTFFKTRMPYLTPQHCGQWAAHKHSIKKIWPNNELMFIFRNPKFFSLSWTDAYHNYIKLKILRLRKVVSVYSW